MLTSKECFSLFFLQKQLISSDAQKLSPNGSLNFTFGSPDATKAMFTKSHLGHKTSKVGEQSTAKPTKSSKTRVVVSNDHLILQKISREWSGNYSCSATNSVGEGVSNYIHITVKCE